MANAQTFQATHLHAYSRTMLEAAKMPSSMADVVADVLVGANLTGHDSHGFLRIPMYLGHIEEGQITPEAELSVVQDNGNTVVMDGNGGPGIHTCTEAVTFAIDRAKDVGTCAISFSRINHIGRLGHYAEMAAHEGCICFVTVGRGDPGKIATLPYGSNSPTFGTNPLAFGVPTGDHTPFVLDFATSVVAEGKLQVARSKGEMLADGIIVDKDRKPSNDPADFYDDGALLPIAGHKGSALMMLPCLLGALAGGTNQGGVGGCFILVMDVTRFSDLELYQSSARAFLDGIKATEPAEGFDEVLVPGDFEARNREHRLEHGISVPGPIIDEVETWAAKLGIDPTTIHATTKDEKRYANRVASRKI